MVSFTERIYDVMVVGGGHAGCEAAAAATRLGARTLLITLKKHMIAEMSCNPAIGGLAKGQIVREVDALGGLMGLVADRCGIQFRLLNRSRGPAVRAPRAQQDKSEYRREMLAMLESKRATGLEILEAEVKSVHVVRQRVAGVETTEGEVHARSVVLTSGTFLKGLIHIGMRSFSAGRMGESASEGLSESLGRIGLELGRLKTGTPPRLVRNSINFSKFRVQRGDENPTPFSFLTAKIDTEQVPCHLGYTNERTHDIIRDNIEKSPLYSGRILGIGPRYCPSIEDKVVKFPDRKRHQLFLEPEERDGESIYINGISSSMPEEVQMQIIRSIEGLEGAEFLRPGYAIEYDYVKPTQLRATLEAKEIEGLFFAGQINGTSGYEEAAGQGIIAGANAAIRAKERGGKEQLILDREISYIGVMIDDLITRGVDEPYRMFTSRAENRLQLRTDNADRRLTQIGREHGLVNEERWKAFQEKTERLDKARDALDKNHLASGEEAAKLGLELQGELAGKTSLLEMLKRVEVSISRFAGSFEGLMELDEEELLTIETDIKYEGYVRRQEGLKGRLTQQEHFKIPGDLDYGMIPGLSKESAQRLEKVRPETLGQASRVHGMTPAAVAALAIELMKRRID